MSVTYRLRQDTITFDGATAESYGVDALNECGKALISISDISLNRTAVQALVDDLNACAVELVHLNDVVYDFYYDNI